MGPQGLTELLSGRGLLIQGQWLKRRACPLMNPCIATTAERAPSEKARKSFFKSGKNCIFNSKNRLEVLKPQLYNTTYCVFME